MSTVTIKTNNVPRQLIFGYELSEKEKADFDYIEDIEAHDFLKYKGEIYDPSDFMYINPSKECLPKGFEKWDGYVSDSFFSGILIKYCNDFESVIVATYYS